MPVIFGVIPKGKNMKLVVAVILYCFLYGCAKNSEEPNRKYIDFDHLISSDYTINTSRRIEFIESSDRIIELISNDGLEGFGLLDQIDTDLSEEVALFIVMGNQKSDNFKVSVKEIYLEDDYLFINIEHYTNNDCPESNSSINPYTIVKFEKYENQIILNEKVIETMCQI